MAALEPVSEATMKGFSPCFQGLDDPPTGDAGLHDRGEHPMISLCGMFCGGSRMTPPALTGICILPTVEIGIVNQSLRGYIT